MIEVNNPLETEDNDSPFPEVKTYTIKENDTIDDILNGLGLSKAFVTILEHKYGIDIVRQPPVGLTVSVF